jgi:hypothetical protein
MLEPNAFVRAHAPWSVSKANTAKTCPRQFRLKYIEKLKVSTPSKPEALVGQAAHKALEIALGMNIPLRRAFELGVQEYALTGSEQDAVFGFIPNVQSFLKRFDAYRKAHSISKIDIEQRAAVDYKGKEVKFFDNKNGFFRGVMDLAGVLDNKPVAVIIDHKSGKNHGLKYYQDQFNAYALLAKVIWPHITKVQIGVHFIADAQIEMSPQLTDVTDVEMLLDRVTLFLNTCTQNMSDLNLTSRSKLCDWCDYKLTCPEFAGENNGKDSNEGNI